MTVTILIDFVLLIFIIFLGSSVFSYVKNKDYKVLILISTLVLFVMCFTCALYISQFNSSELSYSTEKWGQFGDYIGGVLNPILSFITILLLLWNIYTQNQESKKNNFDRMFSILLEQNNIFLQRSDFDKDVNNLCNHLALIRNHNISDSNAIIIPIHSENWIDSLLMEPEYDRLKSYFTFFYQFLEFLFENRNIVNIKEYSNIFRSLLSNHLFSIIAVYGLRKNIDSFNSTKYRKLIEYFHFLEKMDFRMILNSDPNSIKSNVNSHLYVLLSQLNNLKKENMTSSEEYIRIEKTIKNIPQKSSSVAIFLYYGEAAFGNNIIYNTLIKEILLKLINKNN